MNEVLSALLQAVLIAVLPILTGYLVRLLIQLGQRAEAEKNLRLNAEQRETVDELVWIAVRAAEQMLRSDGVHKYGLEKKELVLGWLEAWLATRGIRLDVDELAVVVEAAVYTETGRSNA